MSPRKLFLLALASGVGQAQGGSPLPVDASVKAVMKASVTPALPLTSKTLLNPAPYIPPQCYTKTEDDSGKAHNPCYTCHTTPRRPNYTSDPDLQLAYAFTESAATNHWKNLFRDRTAAIAATGDDEIRAYIRDSNYFDAQGNISLAARLAEVPPAWDYDGNGRWDGFVPDAWFNFDDEGFDRDKGGRLTGWRAFAYYPFPGTFWPANGSTDDVLIRLPVAFRTNLDNQLDLTVYKTNLAIVEAMVKEQDVTIDPVDEAALGNVDLDKDGRIATASRIAYDWAPLENRHMWYVGQANRLQKDGKLHLAAGLYPEGTEFLHTVRYIDVNAAGDNLLAPRMKEVRYALKRFWMDYSKLRQKADGEFKEKHDFPNRLKTVRGNLEAGVSNGQAWAYAGFIEDADGELRPQRYEELVFCVGCHGGIGGNRDGIFSFARKFDHDAYRKGWYHWSQKSLKGTPDRLRSDGKPEYVHYLEMNGAGDEFRGNREIRDRYFTAQGKLDDAEKQLLLKDVSRLLFASEQRAMTLNKAYREIVREQSFSEGRDAVASPVRNVHETIEPGTATGIEHAEAGY
jgi:hypothetical protein